MEFYLLEIGSISTFYNKKKNDLSKTRNTKNPHTAFIATFERVQNGTIQINLKL